MIKTMKKLTSEKSIESRLVELLQDRYLQSKHWKRTEVVVPHWQSTWANNPPKCWICRDDARVHLINKRKTTKYSKKDWDLYINLCWGCLDRIKAKTNYEFKKDYCP